MLLTVFHRVFRVSLLGLTVAMFAPGAVSANEDDSHLYIKGGYGVNGIRKDERFDRPANQRERTTIRYDEGDGFLGGIGYSQGVFRAELEYLSFSNDIEPSSEANAETVDATGPFLNFLYVPQKDWRLRPYFGGGVGYLNVKTEVADESDVAIQYLLGLDTAITKHLSVDLALRYISGARYRDLDPANLGGIDNVGFIVNYDAYAASLGLKWRFGSRAAPPPPPVIEPLAALPPPAVCVDGLDNDGDGLIDFPADPGCSSTDDVDETDPPQCSDGKDNDGDGLIDFPADKGCAAADDYDEVDPCKTPEPGERVSLKGCGLGDVIVLRGVNFEFDKDRLTVNAKTILDNVAEELTAYPEITIELGGHTDAKGSDEYNQALSDRRAASVVRYLKGKDIAAERMTSAGYGEAQPVADNETDEGRELNRRVELKITSGIAPGSATTTSDGSSTTVTEATTTEPAVEAPAADAAPVEAAPTAEAEAP